MPTAVKKKKKKKEDQVKGMRDNQVRMTGSGMTGELIKQTGRMKTIL